MLVELFWTFLKIGFISFGGGYAMIPVIEHEVFIHHWMNTQEFLDSIALSGMSPGPIATNSAIFVGYKTAGLVGAIVATIGIVLPSLLIVILISAFFYKVHDHKLVKSAFYGLRPIVTGLIIYAAIHFSLSNGVIRAFSWHSVMTVAIVLLSLLAMVRYKIHPLAVICLSGLVGIAFFN
jgi:chromate transporter